MWLFSYELKLEALEKKYWKKYKIYTKKVIELLGLWVSVCEALFYEWKYTKNSYNTAKKSRGSA